MSLTYGYDLNDGDELMVAPIQASEMASRLMLPGAAVVNHLPFCTVVCFIASMPVSYSYSQCGTFIHGFHFSTTSH